MRQTFFLHFFPPLAVVVVICWGRWKDLLRGLYRTFISSLISHFSLSHSLECCWLLFKCLSTGLDSINLAVLRDLSYFFNVSWDGEENYMFYLIMYDPRSRAKNSRISRDSLVSFFLHFFEVFRITSPQTEPEREYETRCGVFEWRKNIFRWWFDLSWN